MNLLSAAFKFYGIFLKNSADLSGYSVMDKKVYLLKTIRFKTAAVSKKRILQSHVFTF